MPTLVENLYHLPVDCQIELAENALAFTTDRTRKGNIFTRLADYLWGGRDATVLGNFQRAKEEIKRSVREECSNDLAELINAQIDQTREGSPLTGYRLRRILEESFVLRGKATDRLAKTLCSTPIQNAIAAAIDAKFEENGKWETYKERVTEEHKSTLQRFITEEVGIKFLNSKSARVWTSEELQKEIESTTAEIVGGDILFIEAFEQEIQTRWENMGAQKFPSLSKEEKAHVFQWVMKECEKYGRLSKDALESEEMRHRLDAVLVIPKCLQKVFKGEKLSQEDQLIWFKTLFNSIIDSPSAVVDKRIPSFKPGSDKLYLAMWQEVWRVVNITRQFAQNVNPQDGGELFSPAYQDQVIGKLLEISQAGDGQYLDDQDIKSSYLPSHLVNFAITVDQFSQKYEVPLPSAIGALNEKCFQAYIQDMKGLQRDREQLPQFRKAFYYFLNSQETPVLAQNSASQKKSLEPSHLFLNLFKYSNPWDPERVLTLLRTEEAAAVERAYELSQKIEGLKVEIEEETFENPQRCISCFQKLQSLKEEVRKLSPRVQSQLLPNITEDIETQRKVVVRAACDLIFEKDVQNTNQLKCLRITQTVLRDVTNVSVIDRRMQEAEDENKVITADESKQLLDFIQIYQPLWVKSSIQGLLLTQEGQKILFDNVIACNVHVKKPIKNFLLQPIQIVPNPIDNVFPMGENDTSSNSDNGIIDTDVSGSGQSQGSGAKNSGSDSSDS